MRYILSIILVIFVTLIGIQVVAPVSAVTPIVSGEPQIKSTKLQMKKSVLERKIRMIQSEIRKTDTSLKSVQKRFDKAEKLGKSTTSLQKKIDFFVQKKGTQQKLLDSLITELAKL